MRPESRSHGRRPREAALFSCWPEEGAVRAPLAFFPARAGLTACAPAGPEVLESDDGFDYAFAAGTRDAVVRVLTARATQLVLLQEAELNAHACQWLHAFCADRPEVSSAGGGGALVAQHGTLA